MSFLVVENLAVFHGPVQALWNVGFSVAAGEPKLLLIDEVASGLSTVEIRKFVALVRDIRDSHGITVIWVEHIFSALAQVVDRLVVLDGGSVIADAPLADATRDARVLATYLGRAAEAAK